MRDIVIGVDYGNWVGGFGEFFLDAAPDPSYRWGAYWDNLGGLFDGGLVERASMWDGATYYITPIVTKLAGYYNYDGTSKYYELGASIGYDYYTMSASAEKYVPVCGPGTPYCVELPASKTAWMNYRGKEWSVTSAGATTVTLTASAPNTPSASASWARPTYTVQPLDSWKSPAPTIPFRGMAWPSTSSPFDAVRWCEETKSYWCRPRIGQFKGTIGTRSNGVLIGRRNVSEISGEPSGPNKHVAWWSQVSADALYRVAVVPEYYIVRTGQSFEEGLFLAQGFDTPSGGWGAVVPALLGTSWPSPVMLATGTQTLSIPQIEVSAEVPIAMIYKSTASLRMYYNTVPSSLWESPYFFPRYDSPIVSEFNAVEVNLAGSTTITWQPTKYWTYEDRYDQATGEYVPLDPQV